MLGFGEPSPPAVCKIKRDSPSAAEVDLVVAALAKGADPTSRNRSLRRSPARTTARRCTGNRNPVSGTLGTRTVRRVVLHRQRHAVDCLVDNPPGDLRFQIGDGQRAADQPAVAHLVPVVLVARPAFLAVVDFETLTKSFGDDRLTQHLS